MIRTMIRSKNPVLMRIFITSYHPIYKKKMIRDIALKKAMSLIMIRNDKKMIRTHTTTHQMWTSYILTAMMIRR